MACGCQKNKGNTVAANKATTVPQKPSRPTTNGTIRSHLSSARVNNGRVEKRIIR